MKVHVEGLVQYEILFPGIEIEKSFIMELASILNLKVNPEEFHQKQKMGWKKGGYYLVRHSSNPDQFLFIDFNNKDEFDDIIVRCSQEIGESVKKLLLDTWNEGEGPLWDGKKKEDLENTIASPNTLLPIYVVEYDLEIDYIKLHAPKFME